MATGTGFLLLMQCLSDAYGEHLVPHLEKPGQRAKTSHFMLQKPGHLAKN
jgi:hypothetical protein